MDDQSLAVGLVYLDNYEEALESVEEVRRSLLTALIERKVNKYIAAYDGICKKIEPDMEIRHDPIESKTKKISRF